MGSAKRRPPNAGKGRPVGSKNKFSGALKDMILQALANVGGAKYLEEQARTNPHPFLALVGRVLPLQVKDGGDDPQVPAPIHHIHENTPENAKSPS